MYFHIDTRLVVNVTNEYHYNHYNKFWINKVTMIKVALLKLRVLDRQDFGAASSERQELYGQLLRSINRRFRSIQKVS